MNKKLYELIKLMSLKHLNSHLPFNPFSKFYLMQNKEFNDDTMTKKIFIILLLVLLLLVMGCSDADDLDKKITKKADHDIFGLIQFNHESRQSMYGKLERKLSKFCDSKKELNHIVNGIIDFVEKLEDYDIEYLSAMDMDYNLVCDHYSIQKENKVNLCPEGKEIAKKSSLLFVIHNHPSDIPLQSENDIMSLSIYNVKYNIVYTQNKGIFILKSKNADDYDSIMGWNDTFQMMKNHYKKNNPKSYNYLYNLYFRGIIPRNEFMNKETYKVLEHMGENIDVSVLAFEKCMNRHNINVLYISNFKYV